MARMCARSVSTCRGSGRRGRHINLTTLGGDGKVGVVVVFLLFKRTIEARCALDRHFADGGG